MNLMERRVRLEQLSGLDLALMSGADPRVAVDPQSLLNETGCRPCPYDGEISLSSASASTISRRGYAAAAVAFETFGQSLHLGAANEDIRRALGEQLDLGDTDIVLAASAADGAMQALAVARWILGLPMTRIVVGENATGRHFDTMDGASIAVALRECDGRERPLADIDAEVQQAVAAAVAAERGVALVMTDQSMLGARGPSGACIDALHAEFPGCVQLIVDASQGRLSRAKIGFYLDRGALLLFAGSTFAGGPPHSAAVLVPAWMAARLKYDCMVPPALAAASARSDWPLHWQAIRAQMPERAGLGQALRWFAALAEMRAYAGVPSLFRRLALVEFAAGFDRAIARYPELRPLPPPRWPVVEADEEFGGRTIFPFIVTYRDRPLTLAQAKLLHLALNIDVAGLAGADAGAALCHLGQPVRLDSGSAVLTISADARLVSDSWTGGHDGDSGVRLARRIDGIAIAFEKIRAVLPVLDRIPARF